MEFNLKHTRILLLVLALFVSVVGFSQSRAISGKVMGSDSKEPLIGVSIVIKGTTIGTISDVDGSYTITATSGQTLVYSFIGYNKQEITVGDASKIDVTLDVNAELLGEVVAIGYGVQKKTDKTGAVANVKAEDLGQGVLTDAIQALQGKAAGVMITKKGGDPNAGFSVKIRGASGFDSGTQPLYVIDGVPGVDPTTVAPEDIESYNILKDAASTAIYGSRGSNGVIIITTKKGSGGDKGGQVQFNTNLSIEQVTRQLDFLSAEELRKYVADNNLVGFIDGGASTNWQDEVFRTGYTQSYNLSFSGGNEKSNYYASVTQANWEGVMLGTSKERTIGKINLSHKGLNDKLTLSGSLSGAFEGNDYEDYNGFGKTDIIYHAYSRNPTDPVKLADGTFHQSEREFNYSNPLATIDEIQNLRDAKRFYGNLRADLEITKGLIATVNTGYTRDDSESFYFQPRESWITPKGMGSRSYGNSSMKLLETTINYTKELNNHNLNLLGGYSYQENNADGFGASGRDAYSNYTTSNRLQALLEVKSGDISSYRSQSKLIGFFGRAQYNFASKYYASASIRRDGSSRFGDNNKWGWFPTAALGWNLDQEDFIQNYDWINQLKLRASFGISGNQEIGNYRSKVMYYTSGTGISVDDGSSVVTFEAAWNENPDLKWEETSEVNVGIDYAMLNSRVSGSLEIYYKRTNDLLGAYAVSVPPNLARTTFANSGSMENKGIEFNIQVNAVDNKNFKWKTTLNMAHNSQKMLDLGRHALLDGVRKEGWLTGRGLIGDQNWVTGVIVGESLGSFYLPEYVKMQNGKFVFRSTTGGYTDQLGEAQRKIVGCASPDLELGWSNSMTFYKNWTLDFTFRSMIGNDVYNATRMFFDDPTNLRTLNALSDALEWVEKGRKDGPTISSYYVEDGSFVRLDYLAVGYNFKTTKINDWVKNARLYIAANNLLLITGYSGVDPETYVDGVSFGIDQYNVYPKTRSISVGLNLTF